MLAGAFRRAEAAFERGDAEALFASFGPEVDYAPPPPLNGPARLRGRKAVVAFWLDVFSRWEHHSIATAALDDEGAGVIRRRATIRHWGGADRNALEYEVEQLTEIRDGRVARQINLDPGGVQARRGRPVTPRGS